MSTLKALDKKRARAETGLALYMKLSMPPFWLGSKDVYPDDMGMAKEEMVKDMLDFMQLDKDRIITHCFVYNKFCENVLLDRDSLVCRTLFADPRQLNENGK